MSIRVGPGAVFMKGIDAARFALESSKGFKKLKAIKAFFLGISITRNIAQTFVENHSSKLARKLNERLVSDYNEQLKQSSAL